MNEKTTVEIPKELLLKIIIRELDRLLNTKTITHEWLEETFLEEDLKNFKIFIHPDYMTFVSHNNMFIYHKEKRIACSLGKVDR